MEEKKKNTTKKSNNSNGKKNTGRKSNSTTKPVKKENVNKKKEEIDFLDKTNSFDIVIDDDRLKDKESLDFSFIDGKNQKKKARDDIEILEDVDYKEEAKKLDIPAPNKKSSDIFSTALIIVFSFALGALICYIWASESNYFKEVKKVKETVIEEKKVVDENVVFVGDSLINRYDLSKYYDGMKVVNSGVSGDKTNDILDNMEERIYRYNPSKVVILVGTNDYNSNSNEDVAKNIGKIIDGIKENRKYADIYVQSLYPVNKEVNDGASVRSRNNEKIKDINKLVKKTCEDKKVEFINVYELLVDENGNLDVNYTEDGLHINDDAYKLVTKTILNSIK